MPCFESPSLSRDESNRIVESPPVIGDACMHTRLIVVHLHHRSRRHGRWAGRRARQAGKSTRRSPATARSGTLAGQVGGGHPRNVIYRFSCSPTHAVPHAQTSHTLRPIHPLRARGPMKRPPAAARPGSTNSGAAPSCSH
jgi:hypothetical protein